MTIENPLFLIPFATGLIFMLAGVIMLKFPPKKINSHYGYRTQSSMKNQEIWDFAQNYSSKMMIKLGLILTLCSLLSFVVNFDALMNMILGFSLLILMIIILFVKVEREIKSKFQNKS